MIVPEKFIRTFVSRYRKHTVYTDEGIWDDEACSVIRLKHHLDHPIEKVLM
ncbi:MAG TPA: hypothetical protein VJ767_08720 [Nitrososphaeraceae archaeon]|jgi:predicted TIM-barrel enzyme|nr:hypothetical protein [Nitrososphaeraceae archaeon]